MGELTKAQIRMLLQLAEHARPRGEIRRGWLDERSARVLIRLGLIAERPNSADRWCGNIVDLTDAGRAALAARALVKEGETR